MVKEETQRWYDAKEIIIDSYRDGKIIDSMTTREVYDMEEHKETFKKVIWGRFKPNFEKLKNGGFKRPGGKAVNPWNIARPIAHEYIIKNIINDDMDIKEIHSMDPFKDVEFDRFKDNFKRLKIRIKKDQKRADDDWAGYQLDMVSHKLAKDIEGEWHGSEAESLLREDVKNDFHEGKTPKELYATRDEYKKFELETFQGHVYQEIRRKNESLYWNVKKAMKAKKKQAKREGRKYTESDHDFDDPVLNFVTLDDFDFRN